MGTHRHFPLIRRDMALSAVLTPLLLFLSFLLAFFDCPYTLYALIAAVGVFIFLPSVRAITKIGKARDEPPVSERFLNSGIIVFLFYWIGSSPAFHDLVRAIQGPHKSGEWPLVGAAAFLTGRLIYKDLQMTRAVSDEVIHAYFSKRAARKWWEPVK